MKGIQGTSNKTYRQLMGNGLRYEVPKFQRDYTWEVEQWDDLWQDIKTLMSNEENEHYMGYLVLQTSNNKEFQIIDGQQRLTTMSLVILATLKSIKDLVDRGIDPDNNTKRKDSLLNSYIGYVDPVTLVSNNKLKLNRNSEDYYRQHLVLLKDLPIRNTNTSEKHMRECFTWYYDRIRKDFTTGESLAAFIDKIVDRLFFTVIEVTDQMNAFKVFETLNARGVQLSSSDLLKNYLFSVVDEKKPHISEIDELENIWSKVVAKLGEQRFEDYLRYFWNSQHKSVGKKQLFKTVRNLVKTREDVFNLLRELNDCADYFLAIQNPQDDYWRDKPEVQKYLRELKMFQIKQTYSLLLSGARFLEYSKLQQLAKVCSVISFRYNIIGGLNPNAQEDVYNNIALEIFKNKSFNIQDFSPIYISDNSFENDFASKDFRNTSRNHKIVKYILSKIEKYLYRNEIGLENDLFTIEHIIPENAPNGWNGLTYEEIVRSVYKLGNLTLLEKKLNEEAAQKPYSEKRAIFSRSSVELTKAISENYDNWNDDKIASRQKELAKHAKAIWVIQELGKVG